ncbi:unnamed protein product [Caenorhabditis auriculariae]|uniref:Uncharacterized protein n=1 Tax=Caenorhabditis auriculariae TaxID=2777116 RepID=A0A8S1HE31_9PELO|nr:unnamed protein product [Caenorhabditis auriculariae]
MPISSNHSFLAVPNHLSAKKRVMIGGPLIVAIFVLFILYYYKSIYEAVKDRLHLYRLMARFDGPLALPLIGSAWMFKWNIADLSKQLLALGKEYSEKGNGILALWIGPKAMLCVVRPEYAKEVLESNDLITKADEYSILFPWLGTGLLTSTGEKWQRRRKLLTPAFHFKVLNDFISVHDYQAKTLMEQLSPLADKGEQVDLFPYLKRAALDIICETSMGCTVDAQNNHEHQYVRSVQRLNEITFVWQRMPWMKLKAIWYLSGYGFEYDRNLKIVTEFTSRVINEKWEELCSTGGNADKGNSKKAFLDLLLELRQMGEMDFEDVREEVDTFMFEGHDTTSSSMGWTLWGVAHDPEIQRKIHQEVDLIFGNSDRDCTNEDLKQMKYLEKCIKESLRMFPPVPLFARRVVNDTKIQECVLPKGTTLVVVPMVLHRNPLFWPNPDVFDPENFSEQNVQGRSSFLDVPFSAGPRNCIGQKFAMMEEKTVLSWFFRKYSITSDVPFFDNDPCPEVILKPNIGIPALPWRSSVGKYPDSRNLRPGTCTWTVVCFGQWFQMALNVFMLCLVAVCATQAFPANIQDDQTDDLEQGLLERIQFQSVTAYSPALRNYIECVRGCRRAKPGAADACIQRCQARYPHAEGCAAATTRTPASGSSTTAAAGASSGATTTAAGGSTAASTTTRAPTTA